jgi:hypothetical protein
VAEAEASVPKKLFKSMSLRFVLSQAEGYPGAVSDFALAAALPAFERAGVDLSECGAPGVLRYTGRGYARGRPETTTECRDLLPHTVFRHRLV